ncbi:hypothetical protein C1752_03596 [Acaryochloris thomasi RCC1774]|uniref:Sulfotransferase domain-containing protein n=1 Tax=Acaryochloris thomasi RCC1774 TaxID=1764569 RepID=A0A2W1JFM2_9CYAN|nr:sulfotransferase domain-containing protein [Acaryochloris thomasi]PZD72449.1 hypothetical protein C1752_03596 [Acaryochloris thomasi RCC1774]
MFAKKVKARIFRGGGAKEVIFPDDTFLVSYPKSGNTWLRFIIANLITETEDDIDFHTSISVIPEIGVHSKILENLSRPRIIKSHHLFNKNYPKVIYLVRDARDVYVSYYHYLRKKLMLDMTFSKFIRKQDIFPSRWHDHVNSWINASNIISIIRYEDLLKNPCLEVSKLASILWKDRFNEEEIKAAVKSSSFERMQRIEAERGRPFKDLNAEEKSTIFVRKGISGDWKNHFSSEDEDFILEEAATLLKYFNYI